MFSRNHGDIVLTTTGNGSQVYASVTIKGVSGVKSTGEAVVLTSASLQDTNTLSDPRKIVPVTTTTRGLGQSFGPHSAAVLRIQPK